MKSVNVTNALNNPMAIAIGALVSAKTLPADIGALITRATKEDQKAGKTKKQAVDLMVAQDIKSYDLELSNKDNKPFHDSFKAYIIQGYDLESQALLAKEPKTLSDFEKATKRALIMQVGSDLAYYRRALAKREEKIIAGDTDKSTPEQMYFKELNSALDRLSKLENASFDIVKHKAILTPLAQNAI